MGLANFQGRILETWVREAPPECPKFKAFSPKRAVSGASAPPPPLKSPRAHPWPSPPPLSWKTPPPTGFSVKPPPPPRRKGGGGGRGRGAEGGGGGAPRPHLPAKTPSTQHLQVNRGSRTKFRTPSLNFVSPKFLGVS